MSTTRQLGAVWAGDTTEAAPVPLSAIIDTTPALMELKRGGTRGAKVLRVGG